MPNYNYSKVYTRTTKQHVWWVERDSIGLALFDPLESESTRFKSVDEVLTITIFYYKKAEHFNTLDSASSSMTEVSELPNQFHQYLVDKAIQLGYETKPEGLNHARYYSKRYEEGVKEAKMFKNRGRISGMVSIKQQEF